MWKPVLTVIETVHDQGNLDTCPPPFSSRNTSELLLREAGSIICQSLSGPLSSADVGVKTKVLAMLLSKVSKVGRLGVGQILSSMRDRLDTPSQIPFLDYTSLILLVTTLHSTDYISNTGMSQFPVVYLKGHSMSTTIRDIEINRSLSRHHVQLCSSH